MNTKLAITVLAVSAALLPVISFSAEDTDADRSHPKAFVKDSIITTKIKTKLAAESLGSMGRIHVDTDAQGVVWLSGSAHTQAEVDKAVSIAKATEGVASVNSTLEVKKDD
jgi:hyperosmotically inducible protein